MTNEELRAHAEEELTKLEAITHPAGLPTPLNITVDGVTYTIPYPVGSFIYIKEKARKGVLRYVVIKLYDLNISKKTSGQPVVIYTDTLNGLWNQNEFCSETVAVDLATTYYEDLIAEIDGL